MDITVIPAPGVSITISNPFDDQVQMIQKFFEELKKQLTGGPVYAACLELLEQFIGGEFLDMIKDMAAQCLEDALTLAGTPLELELPEIPSIGPLEIPQLESAKQMASEAQTAAMGAMSEAAAYAEMVQDLVESVKSMVGEICLKDLLEKIIKEKILPQIKELAESAINMVDIPDLEIGDLIEPPPIPFELPEYPDPIKELVPHEYIERINGCLDATAELAADLQEFQSQLFGPKMLKCVEEVTEIVKTAFEDMHDTLAQATSEFFTELIEAAAP